MMGFITLLSALTLVILFLWLVKWLISSKPCQVEDLSDKCVLITGCGAGFGLRAAERLDRLGFRVFATCRTKSGEQNVLERCSDRVKTYCMDVTSSEDLKKTYNELKTETMASRGRKSHFKTLIFLVKPEINS